MPQLYASSRVECALTGSSCGCLAHQYGNAGDHAARERRYPSDIAEAERARTRPLLPVPGRHGRKRAPGDGRWVPGQQGDHDGDGADAGEQDAPDDAAHTGAGRLGGVLGLTRGDGDGLGAVVGEEHHQRGLERVHPLGARSYPRQAFAARHLSRG
ncbi:hypothetical protein HOK021_30540 [Streptomyces hygroscopicus]|nr:hypothetical protein HOK021_30540 [Streptomyces hygroscopicus]